ncbi:MAG TPA: hypothetical protein VM580_08170 [Labilithrix sp.]|jgi:hypothetical protein|nr:hypothetical protein [Labilithrix sp.]
MPRDLKHDAQKTEDYGLMAQHVEAPSGATWDAPGIADIERAAELERIKRRLSREDILDRERAAGEGMILGTSEA